MKELIIAVSSYILNDCDLSKLGKQSRSCAFAIRSENVASAFCWSTTETGSCYTGFAVSETQATTPGIKRENIYLISPTEYNL